MRRLLPITAVLIPLLIVVATLWIHRALVAGDRAEAVRVGDLVSTTVRDEIERALEADVRALERMARRWAFAGRPSRTHWEDDALRYQRDCPELQAVEWVTPQLRIGWVQPLRGNERALGLNLIRDVRRASAILRARDERRVTVSRPVDLVQGGKGFLVYVPIFRQGRFEGLIVGVFHLRRLLEALPAFRAGRTIALIEGGVEVVAAGPGGAALLARVGRTAPLRLRNARWSVVAAPSAPTLVRLRSPLPGVVLGAGLVFAALSGALLAALVSVRRTSEGARRSEARFRTMSHASPMGIVVTDVAGGSVYTNPAYTHITGLSPEAALGEGWRKVIHPDDLERVDAEWAAAAQARRDFEAEFRYRRPDGGVVWSRVVSSPMVDGGEALGHIGLVEDITRRREVEGALRDSEARFRLAIDAMGEGLVVQSVAGDIEVANERAAEILGLTRAQLEGRSSLDPHWGTVREDGTPWPGETHPPMVALKGGETQRGTMGVRLPNGETAWVSIVAVPLFREGEGLPHSVVTCFSDVTARKRREDILRQDAEEAREAQAELNEDNVRLNDLARTDGLTGVWNRRALEEALADTAPSGPTSLILLDVDRFKAYNDDFGHPAGDEALRGVASTLRETARKGDFVARYGGEEFAVALPQTGAEEAVAVAERLRAAIEARAWPRRTVTASLGVATLDSPSTAELLPAADAALYRAKHEGRNRVVHASVPEAVSTNAA